MTTLSTRLRACRRRVAAGASLTLAILLVAIPASAQTVPVPDRAKATLEPDGAPDTRGDSVSELVQDSGTADITATHVGTPVTVTIDGFTGGGRVAVDANDEQVAGLANNAVSQITLDAPVLHASAALNSMQTAGGSVHTTAGTPEDPVGAVISPLGPVDGAQLVVAGNRLTGSATGNLASNRLELDAAQASGDGLGGAAGALGADTGSTASLALTDIQRLGHDEDGSEAPLPHVTADVSGMFGINEDGAINGSTLAVSANAQRAEAIGNGQASRLAATSETLDGASAALSSIQDAHADVNAASLTRFAARGDLTDSDASIIGNSNAAVAIINEADSALSLAAGYADLPESRAIAQTPASGPTAFGSVALANVQRAQGQAAANAVTRVANVEGETGLTASQFAIEGNSSSAEAAGNQGLNAISLTTLDGTQPTAALVSEQNSVAQVEASSMLLEGYAAPAPVTVTGSSITIADNGTTAIARGNAADNRVAVSGPGSAAPSVATIDGAGQQLNGSILLANTQRNSGPVSATGDGSGMMVALNGASAVTDVTATIGGNTIAASAYGNSAFNSIDATLRQGSPGAALANFQTNDGPVLAHVFGGGAQFGTGPIDGTTVVLGSNQLAATAIGNQATNVIAVQH